MDIAFRYVRHATIADIGCLHQCKKCGMVYRCGSRKCQMPFDHGACNQCTAPASMLFETGKFAVAG